GRLVLRREARAHTRGRRRARRPSDAALRVPVAGARSRARRRPAVRPRGAQVRRGEDRPARPTRLRVVEGPAGRARAAQPAGLGRDPELRAGRRTLTVNVLVTGGSRGIGRAIALRFARDGAERVAIGYLRNDTAAEETAAELRAAGTDVTLVRGNVGSQRVLEGGGAPGALDVLVHNAATGVVRPALETEDKHWDWTMNANARALLSLARAAAPQMPAGASIVAISSLGSQRVLDNYALIGTSKAAL